MLQWKMRNFIKIFCYLCGLVKKYALPCFGGTIAGIFIYDFLPFVLSLSVGNFAAGLFAKAFSLACLPMLITTVFNRITTPLYGRFALDQLCCKDIFLKSQIVKAVILLPIIFGLQQTAFAWLPILLGSRWIGIIPLYRILSLYALFRAHYDDLGALVNLGLGKPALLAKNQLLHAGLVLLSLPAQLYFKSVIFACVLSSVWMIVVCMRLWYQIFIELDITSTDILNSVMNLKNRGLSIVFKTTG